MNHVPLQRMFQFGQSFFQNILLAFKIIEYSFLGSSTRNYYYIQTTTCHVDRTSIAEGPIWKGANFCLEMSSNLIALLIYFSSSPRLNHSLSAIIRGGTAIPTDTIISIPSLTVKLFRMISLSSKRKISPTYTEKKNMLS